MSLTVSGIIGISSEIEEVTVGESTFFNFEAASPDHRKPNVRHKYRASISVSARDLEEARGKLKKGKVILLHGGSCIWSAEEVEKDGKKNIYNRLRMSWRDITVLGWFNNPRSESKES